MILKILFIIILIVVGLILSLVIYPIMKKKQNLVKNTDFTTVAKLLQTFEQMTILDKGDTYFEYVSLMGKIKNIDSTITPFSKKLVAYYESIANIIVEKRELVQDERGFSQTKITKIEKTIFNQKNGNRLELVDKSTPESVVLEINSGGCEMDIPLTLEKEVTEDEFKSYNLNIEIPQELMDTKVLGYKIKEKTLDNDSIGYVVGEARKSGGKIHICLSRDLKKPFILSTKAKEEFIKKYKQNSYLYLVVGFICISIGLVLIFI